MLQGSSASTPEDLEKVDVDLRGLSVPDNDVVSSQVTPLLRHHPNLQEELRGLFQQFHHQSLSLATAGEDVNRDIENPHDGSEIEEHEESDTGRDAEDEKVFAKNISLISSGEKVVVWTR